MESPTSTFTLLEHAQAGDREALTRVFEKYRRRLSVLVRFKRADHTRTFAEVDDIVQETLLRASRDIQHFSYRTPGSFLRWLSSIADHAIVDRVRYLGRRLLAQREAVERLLGRLAALPEDCRKAHPDGQNRRPVHRRDGPTTGQIARSRGPAGIACGETLPRPERGGRMTDPEREQQLAEALADLLDRKSTEPVPAELAPEWSTLLEIDRAVDPAALPERLSGHTILVEIGSGGMGRVLLAVEQVLGSKVTIKTGRYADDALLQARFMGEAR